MKVNVEEKSRCYVVLKKQQSGQSMSVFEGGRSPPHPTGDEIKHSEISFVPQLRELRPTIALSKLYVDIHQY